MNQTVLIGNIISLLPGKNLKDYAYDLLLEVNRDFQESNGNYLTDIFTVRLWRGIGEEISAIYKKGDCIGIKGRLMMINSEMIIIGEKIELLNRTSFEKKELTD